MMNGEHFLKLLLGVLIAVSVCIVPIILGVWWVYKYSKETLGKTEEETKIKSEETKITEEEKWWKNPVKYFVHGILFSVLYLVLVIVWAFILVALVVAGAFIGLIIGFVILMFIVGGLNSFLTDLLWFPVKTPWQSVLGHGFVLFIVLVIANLIIVTAPSLAFPNIATWVVTFLIGAFVNGYIAKNIASMWKQ